MVQAYFEVKVKFRGVCEIFWQATDKNRSLVHQCFRGGQPYCEPGP